ncbi:hypothetical protein [Chroococcidiopsis sp.]|uniref:hypothetical protein n=1 Tax=Chroococcidiopsis sp. TaxID=3088168 RepID=UPI003F3A96B8
MGDVPIKAIQYKGEITHDDGNRFYFDDSDDEYISITTLLSRYEDPTVLRKWREKLGDEKADQVREDAALRGTIAHTAIEHWLDKIDVNPTDPYATLAIEHFYSAINPDKAEDVLFFRDDKVQFAGRFDALVTLPQGAFTTENGAEVPAGSYIVDLKTKKSLPNPYTAEYSLKNYLQGAAYVYAYEQQFGQRPDGFILVYTTKKRCKVCLIDGERLEFYWQHFYNLALDFFGHRSLKESWLEVAANAKSSFDFETGEFSSYLPRYIERVEPF